MAVAQSSDFGIDFARNPISWSAAWLFVIIVKFIFIAIFEIKNHVKKFLGTKKNPFSKPDFYKPIHIWHMLITPPYKQSWLSGQAIKVLVKFTQNSILEAEK